MASELYVETLKGLTSGSNANKVIIPSGQTLDASAGGFTTPAGHVIQCVSTMTATASAHSGTMSDSNLTVSITPKEIGSTIICHYSFRYGNSNSAANNARVKINQNSTDTFKYLSGGTSTGDPNNPLTNVAAISSAGQMMLSMTSGCQVTTTSTAEMTFTIQASTESGTIYINNRSDNEADCTNVGFITLMEIAG